jgi:hypothetical protein
MWFRAMWFVTSQKNGASALGLRRVLGLGSYETAWTWLHKLRRAMVRPDRDRLSGWIEVDEAFDQVGQLWRDGPLSPILPGLRSVKPRIHQRAAVEAMRGERVLSLTLPTVRGPIAIWIGNLFGILLNGACEGV